ncbi:cobyric acid synthase [Oceanobacter sp. 3_MG-2023]|uniref:cobyric acid synthase n=1 Tax=Oceanobacter sp. 3_MG-2023 TaxID=3062622 RepID=UPI0027322C05|nr:cobyric acid synthase [Oceanobacter sp. 3_MG-2023]MDP2504419.1 cobyric acid synthase [Oceanobacter sp. 3_MG-2023]
MVQGTTSDAGKSLLVAGLCRCFHNLGIAVAPFKPQNMALNSAVTASGGEIGRAQALQAKAARLVPHVDMNPVLLKPHSDTGAQVIIHGKAITDMEAAAYHDYKTTAMTAVLASHQRLQQQYELIVVEGAGSPAEINLRDRDIANMGFAEAVDCPVIIIADIDRGGVFAQLVGTLELLSETEQQRVVGFVINRFRGDIGLLQPGLDWLQQRTGKPVLGVLPYLMNLGAAAEDAIDTEQQLDHTDIRLRVRVPVLSRISNHTDFDMLRQHPQVDFAYVGPGQPLTGADLIILPGSKNVRAELDLLRKGRWAGDIARHLRYGGKVMGICAGYQLLGEAIHDPEGVEGPEGSATGLGYLPIATRLFPDKSLTNDHGQLLLYDDHHQIVAPPMRVPVTGYQIHVGQSHYLEPSTARPFAQLDSGKNQLDGCYSADDQVAGTYLHGVFDTPSALQFILAWAGASTDRIDDYQQQQEQALDRIAAACAEHLDIPALLAFSSASRPQVPTQENSQENSHHPLSGSNP